MALSLGSHGSVLMKLTSEEKKELLQLAHGSIVAKCENRKYSFEIPKSEALNQRGGVFVSLYHSDQLAGCIGFIESDEVLYNSVVQVSESAAFKDPRFRNVRKEDLQGLQIEISILSPLELVERPEDIEIGLHGIYLKTELNHGLLLPQVAPRYNWTSETFLDQTCLKAGLTAGYWRKSEVEIYRFSAEIFSDNDVEASIVN